MSTQTVPVGLATLMAHLPPTQEYATYGPPWMHSVKEALSIQVEMPLGLNIEIIARADNPYVLITTMHDRTKTVWDACHRDFEVIGAKDRRAKVIVFQGANYYALRWLIEDLRQIEQDHVDNVRGGTLAVLGALLTRDARNPLGQKLSRDIIVAIAKRTHRWGLTRARASMK